MAGNSIDAYEYAVNKETSKGFVFLGKIYKLLVVLASFLLTLLAVAVLKNIAKEQILMFIFTSQFFFLFLALGTIYFTNGLFHTSYEYKVVKGVLTVKEIKGKYVFGKTYEKTFIDLPISKAQKIGKCAGGEDNTEENCLSAVSGKNIFDNWFIVFEKGGETKRLVFECDGKLRQILLFYGDGLTVGNT